jgi:hypothetical protein
MPSGLWVVELLYGNRTVCNSWQCLWIVQRFLQVKDLFSRRIVAATKVYMFHPSPTLHTLKVAVKSRFRGYLISPTFLFRF